MFVALIFTPQKLQVKHPFVSPIVIYLHNCSSTKAVEIDCLALLPTSPEVGFLQVGELLQEFFP
jgi:hypothetical protein